MYLIKKNPVKVTKLTTNYKNFNLKPYLANWTYIRDLLELEGITLCYPIIPLIKINLALFLDQVNDY